MTGQAWSKRSQLPRGRTRIVWNGGFGRGNAKLTVPAGMARMVSPDAVFEPELTEAGILYRYVQGQEPLRIPEWLVKGGAVNAESA